MSEQGINNVQPVESGITMDTIMDASLGEVSNELTITFKKTVQIRDYETEVIEAVNKVSMDSELVGIERMFVAAILEAQMEYTVYCNLANKGLVTKSELGSRKKSLEDAVYGIKYKADKILGPGKIDKYLYDSDKDLSVT